MKDKVSVTVSLLTWNGAEYLPWFIKSLKEQTFKDWELLVLDNASSDRSVEIVREHYPEARIIQQKQNVGFARGHNLLINWSDSNYIFVVNQDIILDQDYLEKVVDFLEKNHKAGSAAGKTMYWDFREGLKSKRIDSFGLSVDRKRQMVDAYQGKDDFDLPNTEVFGLSGASVVYRRKALDTVTMPQNGNHLEYFDESFFAYKEDTDLAWRLRLAGWENWLATKTKAYHHRTVSGLESARQRRKERGMANKLSYRNHLMTLYKNSFYKNLFRDFWPIKWYELKKIIYLILFERSTLVGLGEYFKALPKLAKKRKFTMKHRKVEPDDIYKWFK
jgi:GT2 family glycosyltransferase